MSGDKSYKRKIVGVNEEHLKKIVSGEAFFDMNSENSIDKIDNNNIESKISEKHEIYNKRSKKEEKINKPIKDLTIRDFEKEFLSKNTSNIKQTTVSLNIENVEYIKLFLGHTGSKVSFSAFIDNILNHHIKTFSDIHKELLRKSNLKLDKRNENL